MQRISSVAGWAFCAFLLTITGPFERQIISSADAQPKQAKRAGKASKSKSVRRCVNFKQTLASDEESVDLRLTNGCKFEVLCSVEWELACSSTQGTSSADESKEATTIGLSESWDLNASASACETDWEIKNVSWQCVANEG